MSDEAEPLDFEASAFMDAVAIALLRLTSTDPNVRKMGAQTLAELVPRDRSQTVQVILASENHPGTTKWLALALSRIGDVAALPVLKAKLLNTLDPDARDWLELAIDTLEGRNTTERLRLLLPSSDPETALSAARIAWNLSDLGDQDIKRLVQLLDSHDPHVRRWAILSLGASGQVKDPAPFHAALSDSDFRIREWAEWSIAKVRDEASFGHLVERVGDEHARVREWAIKALGALSSGEIPNILTNYYWSELDPLCREAVILGLGKWTGQAPVIAFLKDVVERELNSIIIAAVIRVAFTTDLHKDPEFLHELAARVSGTDSDFLSDEIESRLYQSLTLDEKRAATATRKSSPLSYLMASSTRRTHPVERARRNVAFVVALKEEWREFLTILSQLGVESTPISGTDAYYEFGMPGAKGGMSAVAALIGDVGPIRAALITQDLIARFELDIVVSIGIAAAIHDDLVIGDLAIGRQVDDYLYSAKAIPKGSEFDFQLSGDPFKPDAKLIAQATNFEFVHSEAFVEWQQTAKEDLAATLPEDSAQLIADGAVGSEASLETVNIASSSVVAGAEQFNAWLQRHDRNYKTVDMESSGVALSVHLASQPIRSLVVRGISDFGDERKKKFDRLGKGALRSWAMRNAVRWVFTFLTVRQD